jgi:hypothetical protein
VTNEDFYQLQQVAPHLSDLPRVGVLSPIPEGERKIFPKATALPRWRWNLNKPARRRFDLLVAANVFMYSPDPARWFRHVLASCRYFLLLDLVRRRRSEGVEFGPDGDCMRYAVGGARPRTESQFDLNSLDNRLLGYRTYYGGANSHDANPLHFLALLRGDLAEPILRIDDYPTDLPAIWQDLAPLHMILRKVEERKLRYYLGIAPALVTSEMFEYLSGLKHVIPAVHGYDHAHRNDTPVSEARSDPAKKSAVNAFNEFEGQPYDVILEKLRWGRRLLESRLEREVEAYIPPCDMADRRTGRALVEAGYTSYLSETRIPACPLSWIRSDFHGKSQSYDAGRRPDVVTLHITWEADFARHGNTHALEGLLEDLADRRQSERRRGARLGTLVTEAGCP